MKVEIELSRGDQAFSLAALLLFVVYGVCTRYGEIILGWFAPVN